MHVPYLSSAAVFAVSVYTWLNGFGEWKRGNRLGGVGLCVIGLVVLGLGVYISFRK
jgi:hypothetical protein